LIPGFEDEQLRAQEHGGVALPLRPYVPRAGTETRTTTTLTAYDSAAGVAILTIGAVVTVGAYRLMIRLGRLPEDRRVLR
jgi:tight adherence protein B